VLSGKVPFYQIRLETKVAVTVVAGRKPLRPSQEGNSVEEIADAIWSPVSTCWESNVKDRPSCMQFQRAFSSMIIHDDRSIPKPTIQLGAFKHKGSSALNLNHARSMLVRIVGSDLSMPPPSRIPEHLQKPLSGLADNRVKAEAVAVAAKKLSPDDTQILADILNLVRFSSFLFS
jgi:hypothetical protein